MDSDYLIDCLERLRTIVEDLYVNGNFTTGVKDGLKLADVGDTMASENYSQAIQTINDLVKKAKPDAE